MCIYIYIYIYIYICVCVCLCVCVCVSFQNCSLFKDSRISPCICSKKDVVSKTTRTGVSLHGATSKRDSMWHSPVFTSIRANRVPVNGMKRTVVRNFEMELDLTSHCANRPLHLIKFVKDHYRCIKISADSRKQTYVTSGISS